MQVIAISRDIKTYVNTYVSGEAWNSPLEYRNWEYKFDI